MDYDLPGFRFAHDVHSDVIPTLVFFNNCRLTIVNLIQLKNKHFEMVARCLEYGKNTKGFRKIRFITLPLAAFLC